MLVDLRRRLHVQLAPDGLLGKGLHGIHRTILGKHLAIRVRHIFVSGKLIDPRTPMGPDPLLVRWGAEVARRADRGEAHEQFTQLRSSPER